MLHALQTRALRLDLRAHLAWTFANTRLRLWFQQPLRRSRARTGEPRHHALRRVGEGAPRIGRCEVLPFHAETVTHSRSTFARFAAKKSGGAR